MSGLRNEFARRFLVVLVAAMPLSCKPRDATEEAASVKAVKTEASSAVISDRLFMDLLEANCVMCHNPNAQHLPEDFAGRFSVYFKPEATGFRGPGDAITPWSDIVSAIEAGSAYMPKTHNLIWRGIVHDGTVVPGGDAARDAVVRKLADLSKVGFKDFDLVEPRINASGSSKEGACRAAAQKHWQTLPAERRETQAYFCAYDSVAAAVQPVCDAAVSKMVNSLSSAEKIVVPTKIANQANATLQVLTVDLSQVGLTKTMAEVFPRESGGPWLIDVRNFLHNAVEPAIYLRLLGFGKYADPQNLAFPKNIPLKSLEGDLRLSSQRDRSAFLDSRVSSRNRMLELSYINCQPKCENADLGKRRAFIRSYDFVGTNVDANILKSPLSFNHAGGEIIYELPNHLHAYVLYLNPPDENRGKEFLESSLGEEAASVTDYSRTRRYFSTLDNRDIYTPVSCMNCHGHGMVETGGNGVSGVPGYKSLDDEIVKIRDNYLEAIRQSTAPFLLAGVTSPTVDQIAAQPEPVTSCLRALPRQAESAP